MVQENLKRKKLAVLSVAFFNILIAIVTFQLVGTKNHLIEQIVTWAGPGLVSLGIIGSVMIYELVFSGKGNPKPDEFEEPLKTKMKK